MVHHVTVRASEKRQALAMREEEALAKELSDYKASLWDEEIKKLIEDTEHVKKYQEEPSSDREPAQASNAYKSGYEKECYGSLKHFRSALDVKVVAS